MTMPSISEVGHAKNVANFADLIAYCTAYGTSYNPSKITLQLTSLNTLLTSAQTEISSVTTAKNAFDTVTGDRQLAFEPLKPLATKIFNALSVTDTTDQTLADAKTINNKIQGKDQKQSQKIQILKTEILQTISFPYLVKVTTALQKAFLR